MTTTPEQANDMIWNFIVNVTPKTPAEASIRDEIYSILKQTEGREG